MLKGYRSRTRKLHTMSIHCRDPEVYRMIEECHDLAGMVLYGSTRDPVCIVWSSIREDDARAPRMARTEYRDDHSVDPVVHIACLSETVSLLGCSLRGVEVTEIGDEGVG